MTGVVTYGVFECVPGSSAPTSSWFTFSCSIVLTSGAGLRDALLKTLDKIAEERGIQPDLSANKIKELARRYTWKERYAKLKELGAKIKGGGVLSDEEMLEIDFLFSEETNNLRRQIFTDNELAPEEKHTLLHDLRAIDIFILSHGAIESYYPDGITGDDKPTKALNAIAFLKQQEDYKAHLPKIKVGGHDFCELELMLHKIFE